MRIENEAEGDCIDEKCEICEGNKKNIALSKNYKVKDVYSDVNFNKCIEVTLDFSGNCFEFYFKGF